MLYGPLQHDRLAQHFENLAVSLDAGLDLACGIGDRAGSAKLEDRIGAGKLPLSELDRRVLEIAERAGELPRGLRSRAESHRFQAQMLRVLVKKLAYPSLLLCMAAATFTLLGALGYVHSLWLAPLSGIAILTTAGLGLRHLSGRARNQPDWEGRVLPGLHALLQDHGLIPYLEAVHDLYRAGVTIHEAHTDATRVSPVAWVKLRLARATHELHQGRTLSEALASQNAVDADTLAILTKAELSGSLEEALAKAAHLRRLSLQRRVARGASSLGAILYLCAVLAVIFVVASFYSSYFAVLSAGF